MGVDVIPLVLKRIWLIWVALVLGPFALWFALLAKWRRRGSVRNYAWALSVMWIGTVATYAGFFFLPLAHWALVVIYLVGVGLSSYFILRVKGLELFHFVPVTAPGLPARPVRGITALWQSWVTAFIAITPLAYLAALLRSLSELRAFSIQWPASVYVDALKWSLVSLPLVLALGWLLWRSPLQARVRTILVFFVALFLIGLWILLWETIDTRLLGWIWGGTREPLLFDPWTEARLRLYVKVFFFSSGALLGIDYLILATSAATLLKRALFVGVPAGLIFAHMLFLLGDWNYYLGALQSTLLREQKLQGYALLAACKSARVPEAFRTPYDLEELADFRFQNGDTAAAQKLWTRMRTTLGNRPYASVLRQRAEHYLQALAGQAKKGVGERDSGVELPLRLIRPATYLDADWYALLSAVGYLRPSWSDLEIKKRLLTVSPALQMDLPTLNGVPILRSVLDRLGIPHRAAFTDGQRLRQSLRRGLVPFVNLAGAWTAVAGYDATRDAYVLYRYPDHYEHNPWWGAPELDVLGEAPKDSDQRQMPQRKGQVPVRRSVPAPELERNLHDIGGVAIFLGDTAWIKPEEDRAAFLVELGDELYQEQENDQAAAEAYAQAEILWPNDYVACRILYLKRRWQHQHSDPGDYSGLFHKPGLPAWARLVPLDSATVKRVTARILDGSMGQFLLLSWIALIPPEGSPLHTERLDSAETAFRLLRRLEPSQALYLDTLAALAHRRGAYAQEADALDTLSRYHPFGDEDIQFRLAWAAFLAGDRPRAKAALLRCPGFKHLPRHELIAGAISCAEGKKRQGRRLLERSLKQDKAEPRIHAEWRQCQEPGNTEEPYLLEWENRTR